MSMPDEDIHRNWIRSRVIETSTAIREKTYLEWCIGKKTLDTDAITEIKLYFLNPIYLKYNYNTTFDEVINKLESFKNLTHLTIGFCTFSRIPDIIGNLTKLTYLEIRSNKTVRIIDNFQIPDSFGRLVNLTELHLLNNDIGELSNSIGNLTNLTKIDLQYNNLSFLPDSIGNLTKLTELKLNNNNLRELPDSIGDLISLKKFDLNINRLTELPDSIGNLTNLTSLTLYENELIELPNTICNLSDLTFLGLSNNQLHQLPECIDHLFNLEQLYLSNNNLTRLPNSIINLTVLEDLSLNNNPLRITNPQVREFLIRYNVEINNNNNNNNNNQQQPAPFVNPFQVHQAFDKVNTEELFKFIDPVISNNNINAIYNLDNYDFVNYMGDTLFYDFIKIMPNNNERKQRAEIDINNIFKYVLNNILYTPTYKKIITYCLQYVNKQPNEFKMAYAANFTYDCAHAYNTANGNVQGELSCAKGMIERFVFSLVPAAMIFVGTPTFTEKGYDKLISIIENKPIPKPKANGLLTQSDLRRLIDDFSQVCFEEAAPSGEPTNNSENKFKECLKRKLKEALGNSYNEETVSRELDEYVPLLALFGGFRKTRKRRIMKTRKHRVMKTRKHKSKSNKMTKIRKMKKTRYYTHRK